MSLSRTELFRLLAEAQVERQERTDGLPDEASAIAVMWQARERLKELGWADFVSAPRDGSLFHVIEPGSTGIHVCSYLRDAAGGEFWIHADNDLWPTDPVLWKPIP